MPHILKPTDEKTFVVFDSATGEIRHVHTVLTFKGVKPRPIKTVEGVAMRYAKQFAPRAADGELQVLRADSFQPHIAQRVDPKRLRLIKEGPARGND
jgi:hypothetical protein